MGVASAGVAANRNGGISRHRHVVGEPEYFGAFSDPAVHQHGQLTPGKVDGVVAQGTQRHRSSAHGRRSHRLQHARLHNDPTGEGVAGGGSRPGHPERKGVSSRLDQRARAADQSGEGHVGAAACEEYRIPRRTEVGGAVDPQSVCVSGEPDGLALVAGGAAEGEASTVAAPPQVVVLSVVGDVHKGVSSLHHHIIGVTVPRISKGQGGVVPVHEHRAADAAYVAVRGATPEGEQALIEGDVARETRVLGVQRKNAQAVLGDAARRPQTRLRVILGIAHMDEGFRTEIHRAADDRVVGCRDQTATADVDRSVVDRLVHPQGVHVQGEAGEGERPSGHRITLGARANVCHCGRRRSSDNIEPCVGEAELAVGQELALRGVPQPRRHHPVGDGEGRGAARDQNPLIDSEHPGGVGLDGNQGARGAVECAQADRGGASRHDAPRLKHRAADGVDRSDAGDHVQRRAALDLQGGVVERERLRAPAAGTRGDQVEGVIQTECRARTQHHRGVAHGGDAADCQRAKHIVPAGGHRAADLQRAIAIDQRLTGVALRGVEDDGARTPSRGGGAAIHQRRSNDQVGGARELVGHAAGRPRIEAHVQGGVPSAKAVGGQTAQPVVGGARAEGAAVEGAVHAFAVGGRTQEPGAVANLGEVERLRVEGVES